MPPIIKTDKIRTIETTRVQDGNKIQFQETNSRGQHLSFHIHEIASAYHVAPENLHISWRTLVEDNEDEIKC